MTEYPRRDSKVQNCTDPYVIDIVNLTQVKCGDGGSACAWVGTFGGVAYNAEGCTYEWTTNTGVINDGATSGECEIYVNDVFPKTILVTLKITVGPFDHTHSIDFEIVPETP